MTISRSHAQQHIPKGVKSSSEPTGLRALIVDDESIMLVIGSNMLKALGFRVDAVSGGDDALECLKKYKYDLVLTDLVMSEMDGIELARRIRLLSKQTKIVVITGATFDQVRERMTSTAADRWLFKPISYPQLEEVVSQFFPGNTGCQ